MDAQRLQEFLDAWDGGELGAIMGFVADDCVYTALSGDVHEGRAAVERGFAALLADDDPATVTRFGPAVSDGANGLVEWTVTDRADGTLRKAGVDVFAFRDDRIVRKTVYGRPPGPAGG
jgi:hypothetical protein